MSALTVVTGDLTPLLGGDGDYPIADHELYGLLQLPVARSPVRPQQPLWTSSRRSETLSGSGGSASLLTKVGSGRGGGLGSAGVNLTVPPTILL